MPPATRRGFPLHAYIWAPFAVLVLLVGAVACGVNYLMTKSALEHAMADANERISREMLEKVEDMVLPTQAAVTLVSHSSLGDATTLAQRMARVALVRDALGTSPVLQSLFLGYADGSFFYVRRVRDDAERGPYQAPAGSAYVIQSIDHDAGAAFGQLIFLDTDLNELARRPTPDFVKRYDPRKRPWYMEAIAAGKLVRTEPYMFFSDYQAGETIAVPTRAGSAVAGGDFRLDTLGQALARDRTTPGSVLAVLNAQGQLVAIDRSPPEWMSAPDAMRTGLLGKPEDYGLPVLSSLAAQVGSGSEAAVRNELTTLGGKGWYTSIGRMSGGVGTLYLVMATPQDELLRDATRQASVGIFATALVVLLSLPLMWLVARAVARPLCQLTDEAEAIRRFDFDQPFRFWSPVREVHRLGETMDKMRNTIQQLLIIMRAVTAESQLEKLLPLLLHKMQDAAAGQAGVLYLIDGDTTRPAAAFDAQGRDIVQEIGATPLPEALSLIGAAVRDGVSRTGYVTAAEAAQAKLGPLASVMPCFVAAIPLINHRHECPGVVLVMRDTPLQTAQLAFVDTIAGLSAGALEVRELSAAQRDLFDAFIRLLADAIDAKSPHTGGHCARVPELTKMLARAACEVTQGPYQSFQLSEQQWEELHVAAWLHDCGKVTTPEFVIDKATKLETLYDRIHEVRMRFEVLKRDAEIQCLQSIAAGEPLPIAQARRDAEIVRLDNDFAFVAACNQGGESMSQEDKDRLRQIAARTWTRTLDDRLGVSHEEFARKCRSPAHALPTQERLLADRDDHRIERGARDVMPPDNPWGFKRNVPRYLYDHGEIHNLTIGRGTLSEEERYKVEDHIVQTQIMLSRLPFPKHLRNVPEIAGGHHEKMDGTGYPRGLTRNQMSPLARMMAIADIFEALTAADRPYKKAKTLSESIGIMARLKAQQHIDGELFDLFLTSGVYREYAQRYLDPAQIDEVDTEDYVDAA
ncbi:HD-GYP domain-containing protein (c-di-GMP phosphodiesterase class II) [Cupriavidus metallidurans]|jgi:HD-GYP domain-containing protein (c-di-GMP phosphodiesterase class II)|uniref:HD domain-containing phosphohydrolase n=1 Tax=Cupriavidus TaxID=106589 RepID=UPI000492F344|nr:HD domain-containing phosphohydrolase [Cupriavidus metallidurans]AVA35055.1 HAMP domain-containing protein [Cupriavidus metallidurans]KWW34199.1 Methyl-accepting chemotaxis protein McpB [Cupriavidus metallidurans]MDE4921358.1 HAMP domain-containing protein [Cupriavidus metallidurans]